MTAHPKKPNNQIYFRSQSERLSLSVLRENEHGVTREGSIEDQTKRGPPPIAPRTQSVPNPNIVTSVNALICGSE